MNFRTIKVSCPVGGTDVVFERMTGGETLGRLFAYDVDLLSPRGDLHLEDALGQRMTVTMDRGERPPRFFNGVLARFAQVGQPSDGTTGLFRYRATLRPWLWLLSRLSQSRVFQKEKRSIPALLAAIFDEHGFAAEVDDRGLDQARYRARDYLVQYQETDLDFVSRLMEEVGIFYSWRHRQDRHTLVLRDGPGVQSNDDEHDDATGGRCETIPYFGGDARGAAAQGFEHIDTFSVGLQISPGAFAAKEFDFEHPRAPRLSQVSGPKPGGGAGLEIFEYPGRFVADDERDDYVARRLEEQQLEFEVTHGTGNARGLGAGARFRLGDHPWEAQNREYLVTAAAYTLTANAYGSGGGPAQPDFHCRFQAIDARRAFRTPVTTPRPRIAGPQTAIVVGDPGHEIFTDQYGRVKVHFHWDRYGPHDGDSSCWVRVAQVWAGAGWGAMHIPRVGQEVVVSFLDGDPDRPLVTGGVYNGDNRPPSDLPDNRTQSGFKSHSTPGGGPANFNEIRFEDKKGSEELFVQAEKDHTTLVKADQSTSVGGDRQLRVTGHETIEVKKTREVTVAHADTATIGGAHTARYHGGRELTVERFDDLTVRDAHKNTTVHGQYNVTADEHFKIQQGGNQLYVKDRIFVGSIGEIQLENGRAHLDMKDGVVTLAAAEEITLECGAARLSLKKDGTIEITGIHTTVSGATQTEIKGGEVKIN